MPTDAALPATPSATTSNFPRPPRGTATGTSRANPSRGSRRGGLSAARGGAVSKTVAESSDWTTQEDHSDTSEEVAQLRNKYGNQLKLLRDVFPEWTAEDLLFALEEADGDESLASDRIAGGLFACFKTANL